MPLEKEDIERLRGACRLAKKKPMKFFYCQEGADGDPVLLIGRRIKEEAKEVRLAAKKKHFVHGTVELDPEEDVLQLKSNKEYKPFEKHLRTWFRKVKALADAKIVVEARDDEPVDGSLTNVAATDGKALARWKKRVESVLANLKAMAREHRSRAGDFVDPTLADRLPIEDLVEDMEEDLAEAAQMLVQASKARNREDDPAIIEVIKGMEGHLSLFLERVDKLRDGLEKRLGELKIVVLAHPPDPTLELDRCEHLISWFAERKDPLTTRWAVHGDLLQVISVLETLVQMGLGGSRTEALLNRAEVVEADLQDERWKGMGEGTRQVFEASSLSPTLALELQQLCGDDLDRQVLLERIVYEVPDAPLTTELFRAFQRVEMTDDVGIDRVVELVRAGVTADVAAAAHAVMVARPGMDAEEVLRVLEEVGGDPEAADARIDLLAQVGFDRARLKTIGEKVEEAERLAVEAKRASLTPKEKPLSKKAIRELNTRIQTGLETFGQKAAERAVSMNARLLALYATEEREAVDERLAGLDPEAATTLCEALGHAGFLALGTEQLAYLWKVSKGDRAVLERLRVPDLHGLHEAFGVHGLLETSKALGGSWAKLAERFAPDTLRTLWEDLGKDLSKLHKAIDEDVFQALGRHGVGEIARNQSKIKDILGGLPTEQVPGVLERLSVFAPHMRTPDALVDLIGALGTEWAALLLQTPLKPSITQVQTVLTHLSKQAAGELLTSGAAAGWTITQALEWAAQNGGASCEATRQAACSDTLARATSEITGRGLELLLDAQLAHFRTTKRKRSVIEADPALTAAYVDLVFAWGYAAVGERERAEGLLAGARVLDRADPVHDAL
ncbi:MAG: hypothetical protein KC656_13625, partial [Myxococcales bacterium]|nr:hypothetical protein [Myxococcales bacterium]